MNKMPIRIGFYSLASNCPSEGTILEEGLRSKAIKYSFNFKIYISS